MAHHHDLGAEVPPRDGVERGAGASRHLAQHLAAVGLDMPAIGAACRGEAIELGVGAAMVDAEALLTQVLDHHRRQPDHETDLLGGLERAAKRARVEGDRRVEAADRFAPGPRLLEAGGRQRLGGVAGEAALEVGDAFAVADEDESRHVGRGRF